MPADTVSAAPPAQGLKPCGESPYYLQAVAALAQQQTLVAQQDIYSSSGMKLVGKGAELDQQHFERLAQHKLSVPLDSVLSSSRAIDAAELALEADRILEHEATYARMAARTGDPLALKHGLAALRLPTPLLLRLTVMREQRPGIFGHALRTGMIAYAIAQRLGRSSAERELVLMAALFHDVGEMHTDPALLASAHDITPEERRFIHVHPLTSHVLLHAIADFPAAAATAVLQHHERLDGSGYPHGLLSEKICPLAKIVGVADVAETVLRRCGLPRLDMLTRLNQARFDHATVDALRDLIHGTQQDTQAAAPEQNAAQQLSHLAALLHAWLTLRSVFEQNTPGNNSPLLFLFERMNSIRQLVLQAGFDPDHVSSMLEVARDDPGVLLELRTMLDEMEWLQLDLANEIDRRSPLLGGPSQGALSGLMLHLRPPPVPESRAAEH
ncbi:HD domain-containing protein [Oxalobacteraceae bacterium]|nr:HD domain-containing protein [Oxalobacteraceae bacterium]